MRHDDAAATTLRTGPAPSPRPARAGVLGSAWNAVSGAIGIVMGLIPHVLHHVGLLAGAALVSGAGGNLLFGGLGLLFSVPLLRRLYRRFGTWKAPAVALVVFAVMFSLSAFVIGPAITDGSPVESPRPTPIQTPTDHTSHHG
ncbi:MAG: hypothetical protein LH477_07150 [Nocardioides sp.]|nr:hypothetical protein [Nocardioides sp.]